ncbi:hypothetical protein EUGRSUZ_L00255 [Eucalyptus grandis]|uniref:Uncharacterized protein n=2 Tax=Eucalyptus grandis TaxID=71139 RepID=A0ACC3LRE2_EUCGR|nr:hypothetical protein EUGRSUZ_L00255 [Eucalyptus grandis]
MGVIVNAAPSLLLHPQESSNNSTYLEVGIDSWVCNLIDAPYTRLYTKACACLCVCLCLCVCASKWTCKGLW